MARIVYVVEMALTSRDRKRFGFDVMLGRGHELTVIDVADITAPAIDHDRQSYGRFADLNILVARTRNDLMALVENAKRNDLLISFIGGGMVTPHNFWVHRFIAMTGLPYVVEFSNAYPGWRRFATDRPGIAARLADAARRVGMIRLSQSLLARVPPKWLGMRSPALVIMGGEKSKGYYHRLVDEATRYIPVHAMDYENYLAVKAHGVAARDIAVFIDEFLPYHPDNTLMGVDSPEDPDYYFAGLRRLFDRLETEFGLKVVIAACPRADYDKRGDDLFDGREVVFQKTAELVAASRLVIAHRSTALNYAVLFGKPILLTTTKRIHADASQQPYLDGFAEALRTKLQYFDDPANIDLTDVFKVDDAVYRNYIRDYIKRDDAPEGSYWEIVANAVTESGLVRL